MRGCEDEAESARSKRDSVLTRRFAPQHLARRRALAGVLTIITGVCAMFLFSITEVDSNVEGALLSRLEYIGSITGLIGLFASLFIVISKIISSLKAQRRISESGSGALGQR